MLVHRVRRFSDQSHWLYRAKPSLTQMSFQPSTETLSPYHWCANSCTTTETLEPFANCFGL